MRTEEGILGTAAAAVNRRSEAGIEEAVIYTSEGAAGLPSWVVGSRVGKPAEGRLKEGPERSPGAAEFG